MSCGFGALTVSKVNIAAIGNLFSLQRAQWYMKQKVTSLGVANLAFALRA